MKERWRSSPQPSEQEPPAAQQSEAIPGVDAAPGEISRKETVCEGCGRSYGHARKLGDTAAKKARKKMKKKNLRLPEGNLDQTIPNKIDLSEYPLPQEGRPEGEWPPPTLEKDMRMLIKGRTPEEIRKSMVDIVSNIYNMRGYF